MKNGPRRQPAGQPPHDPGRRDDRNGQRTVVRNDLRNDLRNDAIRVLTRVLSDGEALDDALEALWQDRDAPSRRWLLDVTAGVLRWKGRIDTLIDSIAEKKKPTGWLRKALMTATYQLVVQDRAAAGPLVSETVELIKRQEGPYPAQFANAVLRRIAEHGAALREVEFDPRGSKADQAQWASVPEWYWWRLTKSMGEAEAVAFARAALERPQLWIRARQAPTAAMGEWQAGPIDGSFRAVKPNGRVHELAGYAQGDFFVQDISSQFLVREVTARVRQTLANGGTALDLCAAPGGKSIGLAWSGFAVTASDVDGRRLELLKESLGRAAPRAKVVAETAVGDLDLQDLVWVDAPCSGSGIIRRHPDVRWLRAEKDLVALERMQTELIRKGWERVKPGGYLAYTVCSVFRSEGPDVLTRSGLINSTERAASGAQLIGEWSLLPHLEPFGDGFWGALLKKSN